LSSLCGKICCYRLQARLLASKFLKIVLGGTAASHTCSGVGGGNFLDHEIGGQNNETLAEE
jgi:hypothetical protein